MLLLGKLCVTFAAITIVRRRGSERTTTQKVRQQFVQLDKSNIWPIVRGHGRVRMIIASLGPKERICSQGVLGGKENWGAFHLNLYIKVSVKFFAINGLVLKFITF